jgi:hypothetical protein
MAHTIQGKGRTTMAICQCGRLHVTYGPITPHFEPRDFLHFANDVGRTEA